MKKALLVLMIAFGFAGFIGAGYVLYTGGQASPGYGVVPMLFGLICSQGYITLKKKDEAQKRWTPIRHMRRLCEKYSLDIG